MLKLDGNWIPNPLVVTDRLLDAYGRGVLGEWKTVTAQQEGRALMAKDHRFHSSRRSGGETVSLDVCPPQSKETLWIKCDVREHASVAAAVTEVTRRHQRIDLTIHGAGVSREGVVWKLSVEDWDLIQSVNLRGAFLLLHQQQEGGQFHPARNCNQNS